MSYILFIYMTYYLYMSGTCHIHKWSSWALVQDLLVPHATYTYIYICTHTHTHTHTHTNTHTHTHTHIKKNFFFKKSPRVTSGWGFFLWYKMHMQILFFKKNLLWSPARPTRKKSPARPIKKKNLLWSPARPIKLTLPPYASTNVCECDAGTSWEKKNKE